MEVSQENPIAQIAEFAGAPVDFVSRAIEVEGSFAFRSCHVTVDLFSEYTRDSAGEFENCGFLVLPDSKTDRYGVELPENWCYLFRKESEECFLIWIYHRNDMRGLVHEPDEHKPFWSLSLNTRYSVELTTKNGMSWYEVYDRRARKRLFRTGKDVGIDRADPVTGLMRLEPLRKEAHAWLKERHPNYNDAWEYWDEKPA